MQQRGPSAKLAGGAQALVHSRARGRTASAATPAPAARMMNELVGQRGSCWSRRRPTGWCVRVCMCTQRRPCAAVLQQSVYEPGNFLLLPRAAVGQERSSQNRIVKLVLLVRLESIAAEEAWQPPNAILLVVRWRILVIMLPFALHADQRRGGWWVGWVQDPCS